MDHTVSYKSLDSKSYSRIFTRRALKYPVSRHVSETLTTTLTLAGTQVVEITACKGGIEDPERYATKSDCHLSEC